MKNLLKGFSALLICGACIFPTCNTAEAAEISAENSVSDITTLSDVTTLSLKDFGRRHPPGHYPPPPPPHGW